MGSLETNPSSCLFPCLRQHNAPTDIMGLFSAIYDRVNEDLDDVVQVEINYVGDVIHRCVACLALPCLT